ncbi:hypothetical protein [Paraflavitalea sp. sgz302555]|uniref:hypothetical protein n=1 Tax=Paraflavitalea sp. sgz302555 TaxID=3424849 RepID=UPI003D33EDB7
MRGDEEDTEKEQEEEQGEYRNEDERRRGRYRERTGRGARGALRFRCDRCAAAVKKKEFKNKKSHQFTTKKFKPMALFFMK